MVGVGDLAISSFSVKGKVLSNAGISSALFSRLSRLRISSKYITLKLSCSDVV